MSDEELKNKTIEFKKGWIYGITFIKCLLIVDEPPTIEFLHKRIDDECDKAFKSILDSTGGVKITNLPNGFMDSLKEGAA